MANFENIRLSEFDKLSSKKRREVLGLGKPIPKGAWTDDVKEKNGAEIVELIRQSTTCETSKG